MEEQLSKVSLNQVYEVGQLDGSFDGKEVRVRGFVLKSSCTGKYIFVVLRDNGCTLQCVLSKPTVDGAKATMGGFSELRKITLESYVELEGRIVKQDTEILGCTKKDIELHISGFSVLSLADKNLPFSMKDASATVADREKNPSLPRVSYHICLDNRALDFRTPQCRAIFRVVDGVMFFFRSHLRRRGFVEIKSPKLIESSSEGGANLFSVDYFKRKAFMAQSPQLYKQMAIIGGFKRVYEIGHVYRAEESNINRYLSEFVGLDLEMEITTDYNDVIRFIHGMFVDIFDNLKTEYSEELETIRAYHQFEDVRYNETPVVLTHRECVDLLLEEGVEAEYGDDFNNENEKKLGSIVRRLHGVDFFVIKDYPLSTRPFYTYRNEEDGTTRSYDFLLRGEEVLSGAQRVNRLEDLCRYVKDKGISVASLGGYLESFRYGAPPHGGCGVGLERLMKAYFGMSDIRYFSLFPRDPNRLHP